MKKVSELIVCKDNYNSYEEFQNAIRDAIMVLLNNGYIMTIRYDANEKEMGIVVIEYDHGEEELSEYRPHWLSWSEYESILWDDEREDDIK